MKAERRHFAHGQPVKIAAHVGADDVPDLRGEHAQVHGVNATYERDGVQFVNVKTESGRVVAVPSRALKTK